jgi:hypothetical protein
VQDVDDCIGAYLLAAAEHWEAVAQLGTVPSAVKRVNRAADEMRRVATDIGSRGPDAIRAFSRLLDEPRNDVQIWVAFHILEVMEAPLDVVDRAFQVLEKLSCDEGVVALGTKWRLNELRRLYERSTENGS